MLKLWAIAELGGSVESAAAWIGVVPQAVRNWPGPHLNEPTRDRVLAAILRRHYCEARGLDATDWFPSPGRANPQHEAALEAVLHAAGALSLLRLKMSGPQIEIVELPTDKRHGQRSLSSPATVAAEA